MSRHPLYIRFCKALSNRHYRRGKNTAVELTKHYMSEYEQFVKDDPGKKWSIDRIDEDGLYEIGNCQIISLGENIRKYNRIKGHPLKGVKGKDHPRSKPVEGLIDGKWIRFAGAAEAQREMGIHHSSIAQVCNGKYKTAGGYKWRYAKSTGEND